MKEHQERRRHKRMQSPLPITIRPTRGGQTVYEGEVCDISRSGTSFLSPYQPGNGELLNISIKSRDGFSILNGVVSVTRCVQSGDMYETGASFVGHDMEIALEDRRKHARMRESAGFSFSIPPESDEHLGKLMDISVEGLRFHSSRAVQKDTVVHVSGGEEKSGIDVDAQVKILSCKPLHGTSKDDEKYEIRAVFINGE